MSWLHYYDDEVARFHTEFERIASDVLRQLAMNGVYHWEHHLHSAGVRLVPDFVLVETTTNRWCLVVEVKRSRAAVYSERNQVQAKGYADANQHLFGPSHAWYFSVTNLEATLLFAVNGTSRVRECQVKEMAFDSGSFGSKPEAIHKRDIATFLRKVVEHVLSTPIPTFDGVWPKIARQLMSHAASLTYDSSIDLSASVLPSAVADYFAGGAAEAPKRELLLRCLVAEYLKGILTTYSHARASGLPVLRPEVSQAASVIEVLRTIDFSGVFEATAPALYRSLGGLPGLKAEVEHYLQELVNERVDLLATRADAAELLESLFAEAYPRAVQNARGKAQTDPDLAALLVALTVDGSDAVVLDPGCGDGALLSAAYDTLSSYGASHADALARLKGLDADAVATKVAALRLALKNPSVVDSTDPNRIAPGDMFSSASEFAEVDVVLMNPPFKRYEAQDAAPIPDALRQHFCDSISALSGAVVTAEGQFNIYNLYVEFVVKASDPGTAFGIILDNRWYHSKTATKLRELLLRECEVLAIVSYPHDLFFEDWTIATTILVARKAPLVPGHRVHFVRTNDPRRADFNVVAGALRGNNPYPLGWRVNRVEQLSLDGGSWQHHFSKAFEQDFRAADWPNLDAMFEVKRRGSLAKEGGGNVVYEFPFGRPTYGPKRLAKPIPRRPFQTTVGAPLTAVQESLLRASAVAIHSDFRGYAVQNADELAGYRLAVADVTRCQTLEAPAQRASVAQTGYFRARRHPWGPMLESAVAQIKADPSAAAYTKLVEQEVGLDESVLTRKELWTVLQEPYAGELIIPRKLRVGHRVHVNPFAYIPAARQVRLSSNFLTYGGCKAIDPPSGLTREVAVDLVVAFILSSFGQVQFEMEAYNREGVRSIEMKQVSRIRVFDPRWVRGDRRAAILAAAAALPYPVPTDRGPRQQSELQHLDRLFAQEIVHRAPDLNEDAMLEELWQTLAEWLEARRP